MTLRAELSEIPRSKLGPPQIMVILKRSIGLVMLCSMLILFSIIVGRAKPALRDLKYITNNQAGVPDK